MTTTTAPHPFRVTLALACLALVIGCTTQNEPGGPGTPSTPSSPSATDAPVAPEDAAELGSLTAQAMREAGAFRFEMSTPAQALEGTVTYADGALQGVQVTAENEDGPVQRDWWVEGDYWATANAHTTPSPRDQDSGDQFAGAWDWAQVQEDLGSTATAMEEAGTDEIDGTPVTSYEITGPERTETWWVDEHYRLLRYEIAGEDAISGRLYDYGADIAVTIPITPETIGQVTAHALYSAGSLRFSMSGQDTSSTGAVTYDGERVSALELTTLDAAGTVTERQWWVDGTVWTAEADEEPQVGDASEVGALESTWDWAYWQQELAADAASITETGTDEIDGTPVTGYEIDLDEYTETWWIDARGLVHAIDYVYPDEPPARAELTDHGADIEISPAQ